MNKFVFLIFYIFSSVLTYGVCSQISWFEVKWQFNHLLYQAGLTDVKIPKIIHYVWMGSDEPKSVKKSLENWHKHLPDWKIMRWDETNCDVNANDFVRTAYSRKKWQWVADWCRVQALYQYGGLYLDTDHLLTKHLEPILNNSLILAKQSNSSISGSFVGMKEKHPLMKMIMDYYQQKRFYHQNITSVVSNKLDEYIKKTEHYTDFKILRENEIMFDFGGPENYAEHLYASGSKHFFKIGPYYHYFSRYYINNNTYSLQKGETDKPYANVIIANGRQFYLVRWQKTRGEWRFYKDNPPREGRYKITRIDKGKSSLELHYTTGKTEQFVCNYLKCVLQSEKENTTR